MPQLEHKVRLLDTDKVAWLLSTDSATVALWVKAGILEPYRITRNGGFLFQRSTIAQLLDRLGA